MIEPTKCILYYWKNTWKNYSQKTINFIIDEEYESDSIRDDFKDILYCNNDDEQYKQSNFYALSNDTSFISMLNFMNEYKS